MFKMYNCLNLHRHIITLALNLTKYLYLQFVEFRHQNQSPKNPTVMQTKMQQKL